MEQDNLLSDSVYCRLCCEEIKNGISLFANDDDCEDLSKLVNRYLPINVEIDDPYPKSICCGCHIQLEATKLFMDLIIEGQEKLRTLLKAQQERFEREEKERLRLEKALKNHNPNASVETYTIQTDENGEKFIIQIYSEGPLFSPKHELALKAEGRTKPRRKRGRPPKLESFKKLKDFINNQEYNLAELPDYVDTPVPEGDSENTTTVQQETSDSMGRSRRKIRAPVRYEGVVDGKELEKILKKEGVIDEEVDGAAEKINEEKHTIGNGIGVKTCIGKAISLAGGPEEPVYVKKKPRRIKKYHNLKSKHTYKCEICEKEFKHIGRYELHKKGHNVKYACDGKDCEVQDENRDIIVEHQKETGHIGISRFEQISEFNGKVVLPDADTYIPNESSPVATENVQEDKVITCSTCNKNFSCKQNYEVHLKAIHNGEKSFKCEICERQFAYACSLKNHILSHKKKENEANLEQFPCDKCSKVFQHPSSLFYHKDTEHGNQRFICNICDKSFRHRQLLQRHQLVHTAERPFLCSECPMTFKTKCNLANHVNVHKGIKNYTCGICQQAFIHKTSLAMHMRWHEGTKPFACDMCSKTFTQKGNLVEHRRIHTGEKPYSCDYCGRCFTTSSQWKLHKKRHTGEKPFKCEYCHKRFLHKDTFDTHIRRHLDIRPYKCAFCEKAFSESWACHRHQRIHLGEKPYHCAVCEKSFSDASNFNKHTKIHLKNVPKQKSAEDKNNEEPLDIQIIATDEPEAPPRQKKTEIEVSSTNLQLQELLDSDGNTISFTTADGQPIPIVSSGDENIQGLMPDGTLVSIDILSEAHKEQQQKQQGQRVDNQQVSLTNIGIHYLEENSISNSSASVNEEKPTLLSEDGKVCFIAPFDENSFLTMS